MTTSPDTSTSTTSSAAGRETDTLHDLKRFNDVIGLWEGSPPVGHGEVPAAESISPTHLRIPIVRLARTAVLQLSYDPDNPRPVVGREDNELAGLIGKLPRAARRTPTRQRRTSITDDHLRHVAEVYRQAVAQGLPPEQAVANQLHVAAPTAGRQIGIARKRGFLGATTPGKKGETERPRTTVAPRSSPGRTARPGSPPTDAPCPAESDRARASLGR